MFWKNIQIRIILLLIMLSATSFSAFSAGETIAFLGDSNTWLGGDGCDVERGWTHWFRMSYSPGVCRSFARSGATWSHSATTKLNPSEYSEVITDDNVILNQLIRLEQSVDKGEFPVPDIVVIAAGTNDAWFPDRRPGALQSELSQTSVKGAVHNVCSRLQKKYPESRVLLITPMRSPKISAEAVVNVAEQIESAAESFTSVLGVMRMDDEGYIDIAAENRRPSLLKDGVHTSTAGARRNGVKVSDFLKTALTK